MADLTITDYLKYANLQMAAEAFIRDPETLHLSGSGQELIEKLIVGNGHASKFTETQAMDFAALWEVVDQRANTTTGFSGTLFRAHATVESLGIHEGDLVLSMRSTEFIDDTRDNVSNSLEIKDTGWAWSQISDMEQYLRGQVLQSNIFEPLGVSPPLELPGEIYHLTSRGMRARRSIWAMETNRGEVQCCQHSSTSEGRQQLNEN